MIHRSIFLNILKSEFPHLKKELNSQYGVFYDEVNVFHNFAQGLIEIHDEIKLQLAFELASNFYNKGNNKMKKAIDVCFVEGLSFRENNWAWKLFPSNLKVLYKEFHGELKS